jgi:hypothetical protein
MQDYRMNRQTAMVPDYGCTGYGVIFRQNSAPQSVFYQTKAAKVKGNVNEAQLAEMYCAIRLQDMQFCCKTAQIML